VASDISDSQRAFLQTYTPLAQDIASQTGLFPEVVLGQIAQETGWGTKAKGNNLFGISPGGSVASYPSAAHAGQAYVDLINRWYKNVAQAKTPEEQAAALVKGGYNTADPNYAKSVGTIAQNIRAAGPYAHLSDEELDRRLTSPPQAMPSPQGQAAPPGLSDAELDAVLFGRSQPAALPEDTPMSRSQGKPISGNRLPGVVDQAVMGLSTDPDQWKRITAARLFPGDPNGMQRLGEDEKGRRYAVGDDDKPYYVDPISPRVNLGPLSRAMGATMPGQFFRLFTETPSTSNEPSRLGNPLQWAASGAGGALPMVGGIVGGLAAAPTSMVAGPVMAAGGAAVGDAARQGLARYFDPSSNPPPMDYGSMAKEAALSGAGQFLGAGAARLMNPNKLGLSAGEIDLLNQPGGVTQEAREAYARAKAQGVPLSVGQATGLPSFLGFEDAARNNPLLVNRAKDFYGPQSQALDRAGQNMLQKISPVVDKTEGAQMFQSGAGDAIKYTRQEANRLARDAYDRAEAVVMPPPVPGQTRPILGPTETPPTLGNPYTPGKNAPLPEDRFKLYDLLGTPNGSRAYEGARTFAADEGYRLPTIKEIEKGATVPFEGWDFMKREFQKFAIDETRKGNNTGASQFTDMADAIRREVIKVNAPYGKALEIVAPGQAFAKRLEETGLGKVSELTGDERARAIMNPVFAGNNPQAISKARDAFTAAGKADEWNAGVRSYIQDALDKAGKSQDGLNPARLHGDLFGNADTRKAIKAGLSPEQYEGFENFVKTVGDAARTYPMNSLTAMRQEANKNLAGAASNSPTVKAIRAARNLGTVTSWPNVVGRLFGQVEQRAIQRDMSRIIDNLFTPDGMKYLEEMSKYSLGSVRMVNATGQIIGRSLPNPLAPEAVAPNPLLQLPAPPPLAAVSR
jgi:hypothetical protein